MEMTEDLRIDEGSQGGASEADTAPRWHMLQNLILLMLLGAGLYLLVPKFIGDREMLDVIRHANFLMIPVALAVETLSMLFICRLYYEAMSSGGGQLTFRRVSLVYMSAYAFGHVVPGGNAGTLYLSYREFRKEKVSPRLAVKTLIASNLAYSAGLIALLVAGLLLSLTTGRLPFTFNVTALVIASGSILFVFFCLYLLRRPRLLEKLVLGMLHGLKRMHVLRALSDGEANSWVADISAYLQSILSDSATLLRVGSCGLGFWLCDFACLYTVFVAIGHPINPGILLFCYTVADIVGSLPLTPAGLGVFEVSLGAMLYGFGYPAGVLATAILGFRFFSFWLCTMAGGACYMALVLERRKQRLGGEVRGGSS